jgi:hypothetical protein
MKCRKCGIKLDEENWAKSLKKKNSKICKSCSNDLGREWRKLNREKVNEYSLNAYYRNPKNHHKSVNKSRVKLRHEMIKEYGGCCLSCGISDIDVLDIDHIENNGAEDRKNNLYGYNLYRKLKKEGWPKDNFQVLCKNCNWKKHLANIRQ